MAAPKAASKAALLAVRYIHYLYPSALFVWFVALQTASICTLSNRGAPKKANQKRLFILLQIVIIASYVSYHTITYVIISRKPD
jgi:uncharacterized membrane protein